MRATLKAVEELTTMLPALGAADLRHVWHSVRHEEVQRRFERDPAKAALKARRAVLKTQRKHAEDRRQERRTAPRPFAKLRLSDCAICGARSMMCENEIPR
jgi:hypothetical protein